VPSETEWLERINRVDIESLHQLSYGPGATALLDDIIGPRPASTQRHAGVRKSVWIAAASLVAASLIVAGLVLVTGLVLAPGGLGPKSASAVIFKQQGNAVIVTIVDQLQPNSALNRSFAEHHIDISIRLVSVPPSEVGKVISQDGPGRATIQATVTNGCLIGDPVCPITLSISNVHGHSSVDIGRGALPGDFDSGTTSIFAQGQLLHCSGLINGSVNEAMNYLNAHHIGYLVVDLFGDTATGKSTTATTGPAFASDTGKFLVDGQALSSTGIMLFASRTPASVAAIQRRQGNC
jgi:hypothetical protein